LEAREKRRGPNPGKKLRSGQRRAKAQEATEINGARILAGGTLKTDKQSKEGEGRY